MMASSLQLLVLFYIIKQLLHTPSYWIACLLLPSVWVIFHSAFGLVEYCHTSGSNNSRYSMKECAIIVYYALDPTACHLQGICAYNGANLNTTQSEIHTGCYHFVVMCTRTLILYKHVCVCIEATTVYTIQVYKHKCNNSHNYVTHKLSSWQLAS